MEIFAYQILVYRVIMDRQIESFPKEFVPCGIEPLKCYMVLDITQVLSIFGQLGVFLQSCLWVRLFSEELNLQSHN